MSEPGFIHEERDQSREIGLIRLNWRLFRSLPAFMRLLPLTALTIVAASFAPAYFRWYAARVSSGEEANRFSLEGLAWVMAGAVFFRVLSWGLFETSAMWSSMRIHARMVSSLSRTRTTFFDENPSGRLINRLINDYEEVRNTAVIFVGDFFNAVLEVSTVAVMAYLAHPASAPLIVPLLIVFFRIQNHRSEMLEHTRSFAAKSRSHVIGRKTDLIEGREIFLLYGRSGRLLSRMGESFSKYVRASALTALVESWASFWTKFAAEIFSLIVLLFLCTQLSRGAIDPALAGVVISALFGLTGSIGWLDFATSMVSRSAPHVRRVFEFEDLPSEESTECLPNRPVPTTFPPRAAGLAFTEYSMSYREGTPLILKDLSVDFPAGSKTALIGRTGSGKTSLFQAMLRMVYVRAGDIRLDGESIYGRDVNELRRRFGVVPQAPYLFAGTIRSNLDRFGSLAESVLTDAIRAVGLRFALDHEVGEGGQNLSLGERQLVCLARVIAAGREFILMDEPTSGLDPETDARISHILRTALRDRTVITIAHRLESLGNYDRVIEMDAGRVIWQGEPSERLGTPKA